MSDNNWQKVETIVDQALQLSEKQRTTYIQQKCKGNPKLKGEVTQLLESIFDSEGWLENPAEYKQDFYYEIADDIEELAPNHSLVGQQVGSYTIKKKIGEGGMGTVYEAERSGDDFAHRVAIKIIRSGKATNQNIQRFRREQRILAGLHHPGIARLFDGGVTDNGTPYIIMEYVDGTPIDQYCLNRNLAIEQKINLFTDVLEAVRYAHENLVIHRDLKPGNILVDEAGNIKILDFGISKLLEDDEELGLTQTGAQLLTPRYASPEQIRQENITTASDLYALGIIFYQLLTGKLPFDFEDLSRYEMEQTILKHGPEKPSIRTSNSKLKKELKGDLDAIALKALRKEPQHRYRVANEFLDDLNNYQTGIPLSAREDSFRYRSQKFIRRHKQGLAAAAGVLFLIISLVGFYTWRIAEEKNKAQVEAQKAQQVSQFLLDLFEANDPTQNKGQELTAKQLLDRGLNRSTKMPNDNVRANMLEVIGKAYGKLGFQQKAENILDRSIKEHRSLYDESSLELASVLYNRGLAENLNYDIALPYFKKSYEILQALPKKKPLLQANVAEKLAYCYRNVQNIDSAEYYARKSIGIHQQHVKNQNSKSFLSSKATLAYVLRKKGEWNKAKNLYLDVISKLKTESSEEPYDLASYYNNLGYVYLTQKNYDQASYYTRKSLQLNKQILGPGHRTTLLVRSNLAGILRRANKTDQTEKLYRDNIKYASEYYPKNHWEIGEKYSVLANFLTDQNRYEEADTLYRKSAQIYEKSLGKNHIWTASEYSNLAINLYLQGKSKEANTLFRKSFKTLKKNVNNFRELNINQIKNLIALCKIDSTLLAEQISKYQTLINTAKQKSKYNSK